MPDFLDLLITRARDGERGLEPRTPGLFEPMPAGYGPSDTPRPSRAFELPDAMEAPIEERAIPAESEPSSPPRGAVVAPPTRSAPGRQAEPGNVAPATASLADGGLAPGGNLERGSGRREPESRAVSRRAAPEMREARPFPGTTAPQTPTPSSTSADAVARPGSRVRSRAEISRSRPSASPPVDSEARAVPERQGASEPRPTLDLRSVEASSHPLTRLGAELGALRRAEPLAGNSGRTPSAPVVIKTVDPTARSPLVAGSAPASASPRYIHVSIGQVEVRAASPAAATPRPRPGAGSAPTGLDEYLRRRNGGAT